MVLAGTTARYLENQDTVAESWASRLYNYYGDFIWKYYGWVLIAILIDTVVFWRCIESFGLRVIVGLKWIAIDYGLMAGTFFGLIYIAVAVIEISARRKGLGRKLLVIFEAQDNADRVDLGACFCLVFFLMNLTVCLLWYSYGYNPEGTVNPGWTGVFG
jgi:hypothetical protein